MAHPPFEFIEHTADIQIRVRGASLEQLFVHAADALMSILFGEQPEMSSEGAPLRFVVEGADIESLLVSWLSELLFLSNTEHAIATDISVEEVTDAAMQARVVFSKATAIEDVKAVTYHNLMVKEVQDGYLAEVVFDI